jgi:hypothetical protein
VLGDIDGLSVPDSREHLTRVVPQVPQAHRMRVGSHTGSVLQICGHKDSVATD